MTIKPISIFAWCMGFLFLLPLVSEASSGVLNTAEAQKFLSSYLTGPTQNWPARLPSTANIPAGSRGDQIRYGILLLEQTSLYAGPLAPDPAHRVAQNNLNCVSCHPVGSSGLPGTRRGQLPYLNVIHEYPKLDIKTMKVITLQDRIRGMFGGGHGKLTDESEQMQAIMAYLIWLGETTKSGSPLIGSHLKSIPSSRHKPDLLQGKISYVQRCSACHGAEGLGIPKPGFKKGEGYQVPPIAGEDSYNDGGHMANVSLFTRFIYGYMPQGVSLDHPQISVAEAVDIAAYVNTVLPRKHDPNREKYYPNPLFQPQY